MPISYAEKEKGIRTHANLKPLAPVEAHGLEEFLQLVE
jgi:hypothetical protein